MRYRFGWRRTTRTSTLSSTTAIIRFPKPTDTVELADGQEKQIDFTLTDASGVEVTKSFVFRADNYVADLGVTLTKNGQPVPNTKLLIGAQHRRPGDRSSQFLSHRARSVAYVNDAIFRHQGASFTFDANNQSTMPVPGNVDWAGVGDAYFAMAAIPATADAGP